MELGFQHAKGVCALLEGVIFPFQKVGQALGCANICGTAGLWKECSRPVGGTAVSTARQSGCRGHPERAGAEAM